MIAFWQSLHRNLRRKETRLTTWASLRCGFNNYSRWPLSKTLQTRCASRLNCESPAARRFATTKMTGYDRLIWCDLEMTGLEVDKCHIMEIACLITDSDLKIVSQDLHLVIHQPDEILESMNSWCAKQHAKTGLIEACRKSTIPLAEAEKITLKFLTDNVPKDQCPFAGNTVWMDRIFLKKYMPRVEEYAHYRNVDISTVKELAKRWCPQLYAAAPKKLLNHRALDDIRESIKELEYYRKHIFNASSQ